MGDKNVENVKSVEKHCGANVMSNSPQVSIIIPAYNVTDFIDETLRSVFAQSYTNYEIILINDGSPDTERLEKTLAPYFARLVYLKQSNEGAASARNTGIRAARGEWLAFLDGDDVWLPDYLAKQMDELTRKNCDLIYANAQLFGPAQDPSLTFMTNSPSDGAVTVEALINSRCNIITSGTIVRLKEVWNVGLFDESLPHIGMEDFDLWIRLLKACIRADYHRHVLLKYRVRPDSLSGSNVQRAERPVTALNIIKRKYKLSETERDALETQLMKAHTCLAVEKGKSSLASKNFAQAREHFREAVTYDRKYKLKVISFLLTVSPQLVLKLF